MYATSSRFDCPPFPFRNLVLIRKNFLFKKFLSSLFKNKRSHEKQLIQKLMFQCWLHSQHTFFPWSKGESAIPLNRQTAEG